MQLAIRQPILNTARLHLRLMESGDFDGLLSIFADPRVMAAFDSPPFNHDQMQWWLQRNLDHQARYGYGLFSVILTSEDRLIGNCGLEHMELDGVEEVELGYDFRSDVWNQGFATEAATAVRDFALDELGLPRLISLIRVGNAPSRRVSEKIGMQLVDTLSRHGICYWKFAITRSGAG